MRWAQTFTKRFKHSYRRLTAHMKQRVDQAITTLVQSENPQFLGIRKRSPLSKIYAYELGRECRILYRVNEHEKTIDFFRVCSHKEVYGP